MTLREKVFSVTTDDAGVSALIGSRCYPTMIPEKGTRPLVSYQIISDNDEAARSHDNVNSQVTRTVSRVQFNCVAATGDGAGALADAIVECWSGYQDTDLTAADSIGYAQVVNRLEVHDMGLKAYREIVDVMVEHKR